VDTSVIAFVSGDARVL